MDNIESFQSLSAIDGFEHGFFTRVAGLEFTSSNKDEAISLLAPFHEAKFRSLGIDPDKVIYAEQVHGSEIALVDGEEGVSIVPEVDGLMTQSSDVALGIYVADCAAVWLIDPISRAHALLHSGKKGSALGIAKKAISRMAAEFGSSPADLMVQVSPCIRPPAYEIDFAAQIRLGCIEAGVSARRFFDSGVCTASSESDYYSYRRDQGHTGRMLAFGRWNSRIG